MKPVITITSICIITGMCLLLQNTIINQSYRGNGTRDTMNASQLIRANQTSDDVLQRVEEVRVVCWVNTWRANLANKAQAVKDTWGKRCNRLLFVADENNSTFPTIGFNTTEGKLKMVPRIFKAFDYVYEHYLDEGDWFLRSDDDTYVIMENLRYLLTSYNASDKWYVGAAFSFGTKQGFNSGGASFVLSKAALAALYDRPEDKCRREHKSVGRDDLVLGQCLYELGVKITDTQDVRNRSRFHAYRPIDHSLGLFCVVNGRVMMKYGCRKGLESISEYTISFHHLRMEEIYIFEMLLYKIRPFGFTNRLIDLNKRTDNNQNISATEEAEQE